MANILGQITVDEVDILEIDGDPTAGAGTPANCPGSLAIVKDEGGGVYQLWQKTGVSDTSWSLLSGGDDLGNHIATQDLNMNNNNIVNLDYIDWNDSLIKPSHLEGRLFYDKDEYTLSLYNDESEVTHQLGQEGFIRVYNDSGATITNGSAVYITGDELVEGRPTIGLAKADSATTAKVIGVSTHDIENNTFGYVTKWGILHDVNTSSFVEGDILYLSDITAGLVTTTLPISTSITEQIGYVVHSDASAGTILVDIRGVADPRSTRATIVLSFQSSSSPYISVTSASYEVVSSFIYSGSNFVFSPSNIEIILSGNSGATSDVKIMDLTNGNVIAEETNISVSPSPTIYNVNTITNIPTGKAIIEIQIRKSTGGGSIDVHGVTLS